MMDDLYEGIMWAGVLLVCIGAVGGIGLWELVKFLQRHLHVGWM